MADRRRTIGTFTGAAVAMLTPLALWATGLIDDANHNNGISIFYLIIEIFAIVILSIAVAVEVAQNVDA